MFFQFMTRVVAIIFSLVISSSIALGQVAYELDFTSASGNVEKWFKQKGWEFKENIDDMNPRFENGSLVIEPKDDDLGVILIQFKSNQYIKDYSKLNIEWGVNQYPAGADWSGPKDKTRNTREPVSLMIFFGEEKKDSGSFAVPNLPYFMSFFLGEKERPTQAYYGNYWQEGGRYYCIPCDGSVDKTFTTNVDLKAKFQESFSKSAPPITGLTIEVDVQKTDKRNGRHAKAFINKIQILK